MGIREDMAHFLTVADTELDKLESKALGDILGAYDAARGRLMVQLTRLYAQIQGAPTPEKIRRLVNVDAMVAAIRREMAVIQTAMATSVSSSIDAATLLAYQTTVGEVNVLAGALGIQAGFPFGIDTTAMVAVQAAVDQIEGMVAALSSNLVAGLREGIAAGDRFSDIAKRLLGSGLGPDGASLFRRGRTSAELFTRRAIVQANENARLIYLEKAQQQVPGMKKQAVAAVHSSGVTKTCLHVHGQIRDMGEPFTITGQPSFGRRQQAAPFHWNCRTKTGAYHPIMDKSSTVTTDDMVAEAKTVLNRRNK